METYTLYGYKGSGSAAIEMSLQTAKLPYEEIEVASWDEKSPVARLSLVNPLKQIPALVAPDGSVLTESAAILISLGLQFPSALLLPMEQTQRDRAIQGLVYISANCYSTVGIVDFPERWTLAKGRAQQEQIRRGARQRLYMYWEIFSDMFTPHILMIGDRAGALEHLTVTVSRWLGTRNHLRNARPEFHKMLEEIEQDPIVASVVAKHWPAE